MSKMLLTIFLIFGLFTITGNSYGQIYRWVDKKGTVHFSDDATSGVFNPQGKQPKENTYEILKRIETGNRHIFKDQFTLYNQKCKDVGLAGYGRKKFLKK